MKITHRFSVTIDLEVNTSLRKLGIELDHEKYPTIVIEESDTRYNEVVKIIGPLNPSDSVITTFDKAELLNSEWLVVSPTWHYGYPMPEDKFGYLDFSYDLSNYCKTCGSGAIQKAPFQMRGEPKWGKKSILQLNWIFDEFFVPPDVLKKVFEPMGIESKPVFEYKTGKELKTIRQLAIYQVEKVCFDSAKLSGINCELCKRKKYEPHVSGRFPVLRGVIPRKNAFKTKDIWGSGKSSYNEIVFNQELFKQIYVSNLKGVSFKPVSSN